MGLDTRHTWVPRDFEWGFYVGSDVSETFARGVQWWLTRKRYTTYTVPFYYGNYKGNVEDLIDADGTFAKSAPPVGGENVQGFSISDIEQAVKKSFDLNELRDRLKSDYPSNGVRVYTDTTMNDLFTYWSAK